MTVGRCSMFVALESRVQNNEIIKILGSALCSLLSLTWIVFNTTLVTWEIINPYVILRRTDIVNVWGPVDHSHIKHDLRNLVCKLRSQFLCFCLYPRVRPKAPTVWAET